VFIEPWRHIDGKLRSIMTSISRLFAVGYVVVFLIRSFRKINFVRKYAQKYS